MITKEKAYEVRDILKTEIAAAVASGVGFNGHYGASVASGSWAAPFNGQARCTCAIGCLLVNRQPPEVEYDEGASPDDDVRAAAALLGVPGDWLEDVYYGVADAGECEDADELHGDTGRDELACEIAVELRRFGDELMAARRAQEVR